MSAISESPFSPEEIAAEGITPAEYEEICKRLGRHPNKAELGMFGVMWSEHCCYKNSKPLLSQFPTQGPRILVGPGENAGVVDLGDGLRLTFKIESHNHPSAIEPFQGAATGVGGILRDIFTMGARPIAVFNALRFGSLDDARTRRLFAGVVDGISHYGNSVGVPTVGGDVYFDPAYTGNPLVNVMALGIMETDEIVKAGAAGVGNPVLYVGSTTGRDGMGGAAFASVELSDKSMDDRPAVQVGDPFLEKSLIEACLEAFKTGAVVAAQDMGAAGITCSTSEMAAKGGLGVELDLDKIPVRETGMIPYEYLLSESQERMLIVAHKGREQELIDIFHRWGLHAVVAGTVLEEPIVRILFQGGVAAEIPSTALADDTPIYPRELLKEPPDYAQKAWQWSVNDLPSCAIDGIEINGNLHSWQDILLQLLDTPSIASKNWVYRQYDHQVQNNTVILPGGADAGVVRLRPQLEKSGEFNRGVAGTVDCNPRYVYLDPYEGAKAVMAEAARNLSCVGAEPVAITDNLNFGSPEKPIGYWQLASACRGITEACEEFSTPVTGGNVSLYNETLDSQGNPTPIYPTPTIGMVGSIPDLTRICGQGFQNSGDAIYLLGLPLERSAEPPQPPLSKGGQAEPPQPPLTKGGQAELPQPPLTKGGQAEPPQPPLTKGGQAEPPQPPLTKGGQGGVERSNCDRVTLGASEYLATIHGAIAGKPPQVDFDLERRVQTACRTGIREGWVRSAHDSAEGGFAVVLAESCIGGNLGAEIHLPKTPERWDELLFAEGGARILVSVDPEKISAWESYLTEKLADNWQKLGTVGKVGGDLRILTDVNQPLIEVSMQEMSDRWNQAIERRMRA